jgi:hypothetical protein
VEEEGSQPLQTAQPLLLSSDALPARKLFNTVSLFPTSLFLSQCIALSNTVLDVFAPKSLHLYNCCSITQNSACQKALTIQRRKKLRRACSLSLSDRAMSELLEKMLETEYVTHR